jgi:N-acetylglucosamine-6-phosphate deacetylase
LIVVVDIYCYFYSGAFGVDFSIDVDTIEEGLKKVAKGLLPHGVTSFCPTVISPFSRHVIENLI